MTADVWVGPDELRAFLVPLDSLRTHPQNPRQGDVELVATSLGTFGQLKPIILDRDEADLIVAGNHTWMAARQLGWTHVAAVQMWGDADTGDKYLLMDNRTSDNSTYDNEELLELLARYQGDDLAQTGYTPDERDQLQAEVEEQRRAAREFAEGREEDPTHRQSADPTIRSTYISSDDGEQWERFTTQLSVLKREWGIPGNSEAIAEAVRREVLRLVADGA